MDIGWLASAAGQRAIATAAGLPLADPLAAAAALRREHPELTPDQASLALGQAQLRRLAAERHGIDEPVLLTRDGLEQATRPVVAAHRAALLAASGARRVVDLTAGLGLDARAFVRAGLTVTAVERDPEVAALLRANVPEATVIADEAGRALPALLAGLDAVDVVFVDPARRDPAGPRQASTGRAQPERDPERWSPPWSFVASIPHPRVAAKTAPGFAPPAAWYAEWVSVHHAVVECAAYSWPVFAAHRRAALLDPSGASSPLVLEATEGTGDQAPRAPVGAWLHEPDPAVVRAGALGALAGLHRIDPDSSWLTSDDPAPLALRAAVRSFRVRCELSGPPRQQRRMLDELGIRTLTVKSREPRIAPAAVLRELRCHEGDDAVLVLAWQGGRVRRWLTAPA